MKRVAYVVVTISILLVVTTVLSKISDFGLSIHTGSILSRIVSVALSLISILGGVIVVISLSPMRGVLGLLITILGLSGLYIQLSATFVSMVQLILYAGAVVVLFVFITMMLRINTEEVEFDLVLPSRYFTAVLFGIVFVFIVSGIMKFVSTVEIKEGEIIQSELESFSGTPVQIGRLLTGDFALIFEVMSILLLIAIIGGASIARKKD